MGSNAANDTKEAYKNRLRATAFVVSLLMYLIFIGVNFEPAGAKAQAGVAGERPFGIPAQIFFAGLNAILLFPIFWWTSSLMKLQAYASQQERSFAWVLLSAMYTLVDLFSLFTSVRDTAPAEIRRARNITFAGFLYFAALAAVWIVLAARAGV
jgi:predicted nucleic acid-binding Zn ribbon protein